MNILNKIFVMLMTLVFTIYLPYGLTINIDDRVDSIKLNLYVIDAVNIFDDFRDGVLIVYDNRTPSYKYDVIPYLINNYNTFDLNIVDISVDEDFRRGFVEFFNIYFNDGFRSLVELDNNSFILVYGNLIFISTYDKSILDRIISSGEAISTLYMEILTKFFRDELGIKMGPPEIMQVIDSKLDIMVLMLPSPRESDRYVDENISGRIYGVDRPEYIVGLGFDPIYGYYFFEAWLSCNQSNRSQIVYDEDIVIQGVKEYYSNISSGGDKSIILVIIPSCKELESARPLNSIDIGGSSDNNAQPSDRVISSVRIVQSTVLEIDFEEIYGSELETDARESSSLILDSPLVIYIFVAIIAAGIISFLYKRKMF